MDRRSLGLGVIIVVLVTALTVPLLAGRKVVGIAVALTVPAAPRVGDCLLDIAPDPASSTGAGPAPEVVPCTSPHHAEVITQTVTVVDALDRRSGGGDVPDLAACANTAYWYPGVHPLDRAGERSAVLGPWWPAFSADFQSLLPGPLQLRIGQSWVACVVTSPHELTSGSVAHLFGGPPRPNPVALCTPPGQIQLRVAIDCDQPHPTEIVGWRVADENTATPRLFDQSCADLSGRITGMTDPTAQGALRSAVVIIRSADGAVHAGWGPGREAPYRAACTISTASSRLLTGSLTGLGNAPVPWA